MFTFFLVSLNFLYLFFFCFSKVSFGFFICFVYLGFCWLFFYSLVFISSFSFYSVFHFTYDFYIVFSLDSISFLFFFLILVVFTAWFFYICIIPMSSNSFSNVLSVFFSLLHISLFVIFVSNIGLFVIFLEFLSIPIFFLFTSVRSSDWFIGLTFILFYSAFTGVLFLLSLSYMFCCDWFFLISYSSSYYIFLLFFSFLVKSAFFPFHSWLPFVHGLCSTSGSVFLAGVFLKLGSYGLVRLYCSISFFSFFQFYHFIFILLAFFGCVFSLFSCVFQLDFKKFIAFSSISHMNFSILVLFLGGVIPAILIWLSHAFITSLLFFNFGYIYSIFGSKLTLFYGNSIFSRLWYFQFVFLLLLDVGFPPFISFYSELLSFSYI